MNLCMVAHIVFPARAGREEISMRRVSSVRIESSWDTLTDTAKVELPRNREAFRNKDLRDFIRRGDQVIIYLGYDQDLREEFRGYVRSVEADTPTIIHIEDGMWQLKQEVVSVASASMNLQELVSLMGYTGPTEVADIDIGAVRFSRMTPAAILEKVRQKFGIRSYFKSDTLVSGLVYSDDDELVEFSFDGTIKLNHNLEYRSAEDTKVKVRAVSVQSGGGTLEYETGDTAGDEYKLNYYNVSLATLKTLADNDLKRLKKGGFKGTFNTFGRPVVQHGYRVSLSSSEYPDRDGVYYVKKVVKTFDSSGFNQAITIDSQAA